MRLREPDLLFPNSDYSSSKQYRHWFLVGGADNREYRRLMAELGGAHVYGD
jgi:hypothetical protein